MNALIVYESMYGNTKAIAEAIAEGLACEATLRSVHEAGPIDQEYDLVVVGGPTHMHGLSTSMSRSMAASAAKEDAGRLLPDATEGPGLRHWLRELYRSPGTRAAAFDTRGDGKAALTGSAARGIAKRLKLRGYHVIGSESFLVADAEGPLADGELERAREWGASLAAARVPA
jgi:flavodoxin